MTAPVTHRNAVLVGALVTAGAAILTGGLFAIGSLRDGFDASIEVQAVFDRVDGLSNGDAIWFSGVPVGTVAGVSLVQGGVEARLRIDEEASQHIPSDSVARVSSDGLIGNPIVVLADGTPSAQPLQDEARLASVDAVSMEQLMEEFQQTNQTLLAVGDDLEVVTGRVAAGEGTLGRLLADDELYGDLSSAVARLEGSSSDVARMTDHLASLSERLDHPDSLPSRLAADRTSYEALQRSLASVEETADSAAALVSDVRSSAADPDTPVGVLLQDEGAGRDLEETMEHLSASSEHLEKSLGALQHSFLLKPLFKRQERAEERKRAVVVAQPAPAEGSSPDVASADEE